MQQKKEQQHHQISRKNTDMTGFGEQMIDKASQYLHQKYGISTFYAGLRDEKDPSIPLFEEAGYVMEDGVIEIEV